MGTFRCSAIECAQVPRAGLEVYWARPTLVVIRHHVPLRSSTGGGDNLGLSEPPDGTDGVHHPVSIPCRAGSWIPSRFIRIGPNLPLGSGHRRDHSQPPRGLSSSRPLSSCSRHSCSSSRLSLARLVTARG